MIVWMSPHDPRVHRFVVVRPPHPPLDLRLETRSLLLHDLAHYAVEAEQEAHGFYARVAAGADPAQLREASLDEPAWAQLIEVESAVVRLQTAFKRGTVPPGTPGADTLRRLWGAWSKVRPPRGLQLRWPPAAFAVGPCPDLRV